MIDTRILKRKDGYFVQRKYSFGWSDLIIERLCGPHEDRAKAQSAASEYILKCGNGDLDVEYNNNINFNWSDIV